MGRTACAEPQCLYRGVLMYTDNKPNAFYAQRWGRKLKMQLKNGQIIFISCIACGIRESSTKLRVPQNTVWYQWARQFLHESVSVMKCRKAFKLILSIYLGTVNFKFKCFLRAYTPPEPRIIPSHSSWRIKCRLATENQPPLHGVIIGHIFMNFGQVHGFRVLHSPQRMWTEMKTVSNDLGDSFFGYTMLPFTTQHRFLRAAHKWLKPSNFSSLREICRTLIVYV
jgi:hypothetical protein